MDFLSVFLSFSELIIKCFILFLLTLTLGKKLFPFRILHQIGFSLCAVFILSYLQFWIYFLSPTVGTYLTETFFALGIIFILFSKVKIKKVLKKATFLLCITGVVTLFSYSVSTLYPTGRGELVDVGDRYFHHYSDHAIPQIFADKLRHAEPLTPIIADWLSSDRPPLQTSFLLFFNVEGLNDISYLYAAIFCQALALTCTYLLLRRLRVPKTQSFIIFLYLMSSLSISMQISYVWPKLFGAAFTILGILFLRKRWKWSSLIIAGCSFGLALLAHGATAFGILAACAAYFLIFGLRRTLSLIIPLSIAGLLLFSWNLYARWYDPPGNRLAKWHLAGSLGIDQKSVLQVLKENYLEVPIKGVIKNKINNFTYAAGIHKLFSQERYTYPSWKLIIWQESVKSIFPSMGLLCVGYGLLLFRRYRNTTSTYLGLLLAFSYGVWCLLQYGSMNIRTGEQILAGAEAWHAPYSFIIFGLTLPLYIITSLQTRWKFLLLALHVTFGVVMLLLPPIPINFPEPQHLAYSRLVLFFVSSAGLFYLWRNQRRILI